MPHFKFSIIIIVVFIPLMLLLGELASHNFARSDTDTALRQSALASMKEGIARGSLRDTNIPGKEYQHTVRINPDDVIKRFEESTSASNLGTLINLAEQDEALGFSASPPMLAIRSNTVRRSMVYEFLHRFNDQIPPALVVQNEKIVILELKED